MTIAIQTNSFRLIIETPTMFQNLYIKLQDTKYVYLRPQISGEKWVQNSDIQKLTTRINLEHLKKKSSSPISSIQNQNPIPTKN